MENSNKMIPPHLNAEVYRTDTTGTNTMAYLDHIHIHPDGSFLVGCSELTGRYWTGGANITRSLPEALNRQNESKKSIYLTNGTSDGCFIDTMKVLLCEDNGAVSVWGIDEDDAWKIWNEETSAAEHDGAAIAVDCLDIGKEYVTVGADGNIKVWDINEMICLRNYNAAHSMAIYGVAVKPKSTNSFATASQDQYVSLWDNQIAKPALDLVKNDCGVRCLQWLDENKLVYGDEAGILRLIDIRNNEHVMKLTEYPAAIHKVTVNTESGKFAVCCDNKILTVCEVSESEKLNEIYHDRHMHSNYVRSVAWDPIEENVLHSVAWDGTIKTHKLVYN